MTPGMASSDLHVRAGKQGPPCRQVARFVLLTFMACCESSASDIGVDFVLGALLPAMVRTVALPGVARACA